MTTRRTFFSGKRVPSARNGGQDTCSRRFPQFLSRGMSNLATHILYRTLNDGMMWCANGSSTRKAGRLSRWRAPGPSPPSSRLLHPLLRARLSQYREMLEGSKVAVLAGSEGGAPRSSSPGDLRYCEPEPVSPFFDLMVMGDIEATVPSFMERFIAGRDSGRGRIVESSQHCPSFTTLQGCRCGTVEMAGWKVSIPLVSPSPWSATRERRWVCPS
jgi:hypothetical protein